MVQLFNLKQGTLCWRPRPVWQGIQHFHRSFWESFPHSHHRWKWRACSSWDGPMVLQGMVCLQLCTFVLENWICNWNNYKNLRFTFLFFLSEIVETGEECCLDCCQDYGKRCQDRGYYCCERGRGRRSCCCPWKEMKLSYLVTIVLRYSFKYLYRNLLMIRIVWRLHK